MYKCIHYMHLMWLLRGLRRKNFKFSAASPLGFHLYCSQSVGGTLLLDSQRESVFTWSNAVPKHAAPGLCDCNCMLVETVVPLLKHQYPAALQTLKMFKIFFQELYTVLLFWVVETTTLTIIEDACTFRWVYLSHYLYFGVCKLEQKSAFSISN